jgi:asparagine synthase (glutamine-hydrolysing)
MCGIVGVVSPGGVPLEYPLERMRETLAHRGPDDAGAWWSSDRRVALGHRRLAVIDPSPAGHQPMCSTSGQSVIVFNGEIYNYRDLRHELEARGSLFRTATDTEVILEGYEAWGVDVLGRLNGMFAFGLVDLGRGELLLARDRAGEKPLFIGRFADRFVFGSELKALLADPLAPRVLDRTALDFYLAYGYVPGARCLLRGFQKLPAAHALTLALDTGVERTWEYWRAPQPAWPGSPDRASRPSTRRLADELSRLLEDAVARQLVADVPIGVLLSGGLDSSLIAAMAVRGSATRVRTFTVTFPGHPSHDEGPHARLVASHLGTDHTELEAEAAVVDLLPELARQFDEPIADSALVPTFLLARLIRRHATVAVGGDGGDELFGGYPHYRWLMDLSRVKRVVPSAARSAASRVGAALPAGVRGRHHLVGLTGDIGESIAHVNLYFDRASRSRVVPLAATEDGPDPEAWRGGLGAGSADPRDRAMRADFASTLADGYLVRVDRASMKAGLEVRAPFLDHRLVEFAMSRVPPALKVTRRARKILLQRLAERLLPPTFDRRRKQGFTMPLGAWFSQGWGDLFADTLGADTDLFDRAAVDRLIAGQRAGRANTARLFALTMLALWRKEYKIAL